MCQSVRAAIVRIAALVFAVLSTTLAAQQTYLAVKVTDCTGEVISGARIQIDPSPIEAKTSTTANRQGEAGLDPPPGSYVLSITYRGFKRWTRQIEVRTATVKRSWAGDRSRWVYARFSTTAPKSSQF
jgi:hypothetical protein